jgi:hypothetical protein
MQQGKRQGGDNSEGALPEVTLAMKRAGVYAARQHTLGEPLEDLVTNVYLVMALEASASEIICSK